MKDFILDYRRGSRAAQARARSALPAASKTSVSHAIQSNQSAAPLLQSARGLAALLAALEGLAIVTPVLPGNADWLLAVRDFLHSFALPALMAFCGMAIGAARAAPWPAYVASRLVPALGALGLWAGALAGLIVLRGGGWPNDWRLACEQAIPLLPMGAALVVLPLFILAWKAMWGMRTGAVFVLAALLEIMHTEQGALIWIEAMRGFAYFAAGHVLAPQLRAIARFARANVTTAGLMLSSWFAFNALMTSSFLPRAFGEKIATLPFASLGLGLAGLCAVTLAGELLAVSRFGRATSAVAGRWKLWYGGAPLGMMALAAGLTGGGLFADESQAIAALLLSALAGGCAMAIAALCEPELALLLRRKS